MWIFDSQSPGFRLCGYQAYAVAAAVSCCLRKDPTGSVYDENQLNDSFNESKLSHNVVHETFPYISLQNDIRTVLQVKKSKLYCTCQVPHNGRRMIQSTSCGQWFNVICIPLSCSPLEDADKEWAGPCCCTGIRDPFQVRKNECFYFMTNKISRTYIYFFTFKEKKLEMYCLR